MRWQKDARTKFDHLPLVFCRCGVSGEPSTSSTASGPPSPRGEGKGLSLIHILKLNGEKDAALRPLVKAADKIAAAVKCVEEKKSGNREFVQAEQTILQNIRDLHLPEADYYVKEFLPSYGLTIEEQDYTREAGLKFAESSQLVFTKVLK